MKKQFYTLLIALIVTQIGRACSCFDTGSFCESVGFLKGIEGLKFNVVQVVVKAKDGQGMKVTVVESFWGEAPIGTEFSIRNGSGADCAISTDPFEIGEQYMFALEASPDQVQSVSTCGTFFLRIEDNRVKGNIAPGIEEVDLFNFADLSDCGELIKPTEPYFTVLPNLLNYDMSLVALPSVWENVTDVNIWVFDMNGRLVVQQRAADYSGEEPLRIETNGWATGMYILQMEYWGKRQTMKIVKAS